MRVLGIDPGKTIGLCVYDTVLRKVMDATQCHTVSDAHREITRMAFVDTVAAAASRSKAEWMAITQIN